MKTASPLRYPGGKSAIAGLLRDIRRLNGLGGRTIAEPFAGGAGASLTLLFLEEVNRLHINDADPAVFDFWWTLVHRPGPFLTMITKRPLSMPEWRRQRDVYRDRGRVSRLERGFAAFYLNRCNRSGIIMNGGPIGGVNQTGEWKLDARFNRGDLRARCERIAKYGERIRVSCDDGLDFIERLDSKSTFFFVDPPYFEKGPTLYLNALDVKYHRELAARLRAMRDASWVLTYDDCPEVRRMYRGWAAVRPFSLRYTAAAARTGKELLITPKWIRLPESQGSAAVSW
jgi:DNA adenine methylase